MKLVASLIVRNELGRYLVQSVDALLDFCDEIRVVDDWSDDGTFEWLAGRHRAVKVTRTGSKFKVNEGNARQAAFEWALEGNPSHILAIDADEFIADGRALRAAVEEDPDGQGVFKLCMLEVWNMTPEGFETRIDGGWAPHAVPILYGVPAGLSAGDISVGDWRIPDRKLASGREPVAVRNRSRHVPHGTFTEILHLGWARQSERFARYERYRVADGGRFHANAHLESILWQPPRLQLCPCPWPVRLASRATELAYLASL